MLLVIALALSAGAAAAQQPQGSSQFNAFREKHKYTFQLMQMVRHIGEIDKDKKYALTPAQAGKVLAILKPLRSKPKLTQDQAKQALKDLKKVFTADQLNAMARIRPMFRPGEPGRPGQPGGMRGGPPGGGQGQNRERRWDPNAMKDFNPFYAQAKPDDERAKQRIKRYNDFFSALEKKANPKKTAPAPTKKPAAASKKKS